MFLHLSVSHSVHKGGGCLPQCMMGYTSPKEADTPLGGRNPPWEQTPPGSRHPLPRKQTLPEADTPRKHTPSEADTLSEAATPLCCACWEIWATSGQYASYWNAYLFLFFLPCFAQHIISLIFCFFIVQIQNFPALLSLAYDFSPRNLSFWS